MVDFIFKDQRVIVTTNASGALLLLLVFIFSISLGWLLLRARIIPLLVAIIAGIANILTGFVGGFLAILYFIYRRSASSKIKCQVNPYIKENP
jgi:NADH:ubiquinone oxidoreductase subunit 6 (subunit J)